MADNLNSKLARALDHFTEKRGTADDRVQQGKADEATFLGDFAKLKLSVIGPVFEAVGNMLRERGHQFSISEDPGGTISIHIVPAGAKKSIHPYDWFPTLSFTGLPSTKTVGLHGRNTTPNSDSSTGPRGEFKPSQINKEVVEDALLKFIGEIANW